MEKKANGEDSIGSVENGETVTFTLESNLPQPQSDISVMTFYDTMTNLDLVEDTVKVEIYDLSGNIVAELSADDYVLTTTNTGDEEHGYGYTFYIGVELGCSAGGQHDSAGMAGECVSHRDLIQRHR